jgi:hypothetical protein
MGLLGINGTKKFINLHGGVIWDITNVEVVVILTITLQA